MISLREGLLKIGEPRPGRSVGALPGGFDSFPKSLKAAMHAMNPPLIENWTMAHVDNFVNQDWTEECQGLTTDGKSWFVVSNNHDLRAIYKFGLNFELISLKEFPEHSEDYEDPNDLHIGTPAYHEGKIFVPVEAAGHLPRVWVLDTNLTALPLRNLGNDKPPKQGSFSWCAINPWNGLLYSSNFGNRPHLDESLELVDDDPVNEIYCYDPINFAAKENLTLTLDGSLHEIQGGVFSRNGHLYLTSNFTEDIRVYSAFNGVFLGSRNVPYHSSLLGGAEEMEGIALININHLDGTSTHVHVMILDNDLINRDDVLLKNYAVPDPTVL